MSRLVAVVVTVGLCLSACGVSSEGEPQLIEESTQQPPTATPSFDTETSPVSFTSGPKTPGLSDVRPSG